MRRFRSGCLELRAAGSRGLAGASHAKDATPCNVSKQVVFAAGFAGCCGAAQACRQSWYLSLRPLLSRLYPPFGLEERASKHQLPASSVSRHRLCLLGGEIVESPSAFRASARVLGRVHSLDASTWVPKFFFPKIKAGSHGTRASFPLRLRSGSLQGAVWQQSFLSRV